MRGHQQKGYMVNEPTCWLNYRGDRRNATFPGGVAGPTTSGELLYPVDAEYDSERDVTRVGFSRIAPSVEVST